VVNLTDFVDDLSDPDSARNSDDETPPLPSVMDFFPAQLVTDIKHVIYNLFVEHYNKPDEPSLIRPFTLPEGTCGISGIGFRFVETQHPEIRLPELYAQFIRKTRLDLADPKAIMTQDLYRFYLRACLELLSKYFRKIDKWTYLFYDNQPLFVPGLSLEEAEVRVRNQRTIARKKRPRT